MGGTVGKSRFLCRGWVLAGASASVALPGVAAEARDSRVSKPPHILIDAPDPLTVDLSHSLQVTGCLHVLHNCARDLKSVLQHYDSWTQELKLVCRLLQDPWRQRFIATCVQDPSAKKVFGRFHAEVYEQRWGTVLHTTASILSVESDLRRWWDVSKYTFGGHVGDAEARDLDGRRLEITAVNKTITSEMFWQYSRSIDLIAVVLHQLEVWCEGCSCHYRLRHAINLGATMPRYTKQGQHRESSCPLRGRRAADLAVGEFKEILKGMGEIANTQLLPAASSLTVPEWNVLVSDFARARGYVETVLLIKMSYWQKLPYILCSIAHPVREKAREGVLQAIRLYDAVGAEAGHHKLTSLSLTPGSIQRQELERFVAGVGLIHLPFAKYLAGRLRFIPTVERLIEGYHARVHRHVQTAPNHSAMHVAWSLMQTSVREQLCTNPRFVVLLDLPQSQTWQNIEFKADIRHHPLAKENPQRS